MSEDRANQFVCQVATTGRGYVTGMATEGAEGGEGGY
jgi:hypothetical protein